MPDVRYQIAEVWESGHGVLFLNFLNFSTRGAKTKLSKLCFYL